jgi:hypothetical protein
MSEMPTPRTHSIVMTATLILLLAFLALLLGAHPGRAQDAPSAAPAKKADRCTETETRVTLASLVTM